MAPQRAAFDARTASKDALRTTGRLAPTLLRGERTCRVRGFDSKHPRKEYAMPAVSLSVQRREQRSPRSMPMPRPRRNARRFLARVDAALDDFLADAEAAAAELESGHAHTLARFEHRWRAVQDRLLASLRRIEDHGVFLVKPCIEAPAVDRVRAKIRAAMAQAASEVASELARVDGTCAAMRM